MSQFSNMLTDRLPRRTLAIAGLGLLGGSLGLKLKAALPSLRILGYARREETIRQAEEKGAVDEGATDPAGILGKADLTVVCMPVSATIDFIGQFAQLWTPGSVVTDVGSTKSRLVPACSQALGAHGVHFLGSHPMAGNEHSGLEHAEATLYQDATVFLCSQNAVPGAARETVRLLWESLGANTTEIDAVTHDALVARSSHVPHLLAAAAVQQLPDDPNAVKASAGAFRDVTRIAASSPAMWTDICRQNREEVLTGLDQVMATLSRFAECLRCEDWQKLKEELDKARACRRAWEAAKDELGGRAGE